MNKIWIYIRGARAQTQGGIKNNKDCFLRVLLLKGILKKSWEPVMKHLLWRQNIFDGYVALIVNIISFYIVNYNFSDVF